MADDRHALWTGSLDPSMAARAVLALGIVGAANPEAPRWREFDQIADALAAVVADLRSMNQDHPWNQERAWPWVAPSVLGDWRPEDPTAEAWAQAWDAVGSPYCRLAMTVAPDAEVLRLASALRDVPGVYGAFIALQAGRATPWGVPLRVGFLADDRGRALLAELGGRYAHSSWVSTLIDPFLLVPARMRCDLLVLPQRPVDVPATLGSLPHGIQAGAVLAMGNLGEDVAASVLVQIADAVGAWAVGLGPARDIPAFIVHLVEQLSHAETLDVAFSRAAGDFGVLAVDPGVVVHETIDQRAGRLARMLETVAGHEEVRPSRDAPLARELAAIAHTGEFLSESGDASTMRWLEDEARQLLDRAGAQRWLQARITRPGDPGAGMASLVADTEHTIEVRIAPLAESGWLAAASMFPEDSLEPYQPHQLTVVLTEPHLLIRPQTAVIELPVVGTSTTANFRLTTRADTASIDARIIVLSGNRVLQTARLPSTVGPDHSSESGSPVAEPELAIAPATGAIADRRTFTASFVVNRGSDGAERITAIGDGVAAVVTLGADAVSGAVKKIASRLNEIPDSPAEYATLDSEASVDLMVFLAFHGAKMRTALVADTPGLAELLAERPSYLQVVPAKPDAYFPFELAYDLPAPRDDAQLCPSALQALSDPDPGRGCPETHTPDTVCPLGFWGLTRVIERHPYQPTPQVREGFLLRSTPGRGRDTIRLASAVLAASSLVDEVVSGGIQSVADALAAAGPHVQVTEWPAWRHAVATQPAPTTLMLLPHTVYNQTLDDYGLEIGVASVEMLLDATCLPEETPVIVALLGCQTARAGAVPYETFPAMLRYAGAEVVITTLTDVLGRHAAPVARRLVNELLPPGADPQGMGEVMLRLRRSLLAAGVMPVLALAVFGDADWLVSR